jgi:hypothetical protein
MPALIPDSPNLAESAATARSHIDTSWHPAAAAAPWTRAITGCGQSNELQHHLRAGVEQPALPIAVDGARISFKSWPAEKARPAPASTTTRMERLRAIWSSAAVDRGNHRCRERVEPLAAIEGQRANTVAASRQHVGLQARFQWCVHAVLLKSMLPF